MIHNGAASADGCRRYADAHPSLTYHPFGETGLLAGQAGFGSYRIDMDVPEHRAALEQALRQGINLIDTSANYSDGGSESLIGSVLAAMIGRGELAREAIIVISKAGYLQGQNYELSQARKAAGEPFPDLVTVGAGLEHCIHPEFLADQLNRSLERLGLATLDGYLLHNPEYFLNWAAEAGWELAAARAEYERRIELAFQHLEGEVAAGRIQWYGISSNSFPHPADDPDFTSLSRVWQIAERIAPDHHFRLIQLPMNLFETGAATEQNQPDGQTVLALARETGLAVLVNRPLNALHDNQLLRLADPPRLTQPDDASRPLEEPSRQVEALITMERAFQREVLPLLGLADEVQQRLVQALAAGHLLQGVWRTFGGYQNWQQIRGQALVPRVQNGVRFLSGETGLPNEAADWVAQYIPAVNAALGAVEEYYLRQAAEWRDRLQAMVAEVEPAWSAPRLSQTAVRALRTTRGVTTVLVGMRHPAYVADVVAELATDVPLIDRDEAWRRLARRVDDLTE